MKCSQVMTRDVKTVKTTDDVFYAARLMRQYEIGLLPVNDELGRLVGVVTDRDLAVNVCAGNREAIDTQVGDVMSRPVITCRAVETVAQVDREMVVHGLRRVVVVDGRNHVVGVVSRTDLARAETEAAADGDAARG